MTDAHAAFRRGSIWLADLEDDVFLKSRRAALWILEPAVAGLAAHLPSALREPRGGDLFWIGNSGAESIDLVDFEEDVLITLDPGFMVLVSLIARETAAGIWITMVDALNQVTDPPVDQWIWVISGDSQVTNPGRNQTEQSFDPQLAAWVQYAPESTALWGEAGSGGVGGSHFILGGHGTGLDNMNECHEVTTTLTAWTQRTNAPENRQYTTFPAFGADLFSFGGGESSVPSSVRKFDPTLNSWTNLAAAPVGRRHSGTGVIGDFIYWVCGSSGGGTTGTSTNYEYDPLLDSWTARASAPLTTRANHSTVLLEGDRLAVLHGRTGSSGSNYIATPEKYDPLLNAWTTGTELPGSFTSRYGAAGGHATVGGDLRGFTFGGTRTSGFSSNEILEYSTGAPDSWAQVATMEYTGRAWERHGATLPPA